MTPGQEITRFLTEAPSGEEVTVPLPAGEASWSSLFPERIAAPCARCGQTLEWQTACRPTGDIQAFTRLVYNCAACDDNVGFYLLVRWVLPDRKALILRKVAQFPPCGRRSEHAP